MAGGGRRNSLASKRFEKGVFNLRNESIIDVNIIYARRERERERERGRERTGTFDYICVYLKQYLTVSKEDLLDHQNCGVVSKQTQKIWKDLLDSPKRAV